MKRWYVFAVLFFIFCIATTATALKFSYDEGIATFDGQPAEMKLNIALEKVTGTLKKEGECRQGESTAMQIPHTSINLKGTLYGEWENTGVIIGTWTGGDFLCSTHLKEKDGYPRKGEFIIWKQGDTIKMLRTGASTLYPAGWTYDFGGKSSISGIRCNQLSGKWNTSWGVMTLRQAGNKISGEYTNDQGRIDGILEGQTITGTWSEAPTYESENDSGRFFWILQPDCRSFIGIWGYGISTSNGPEPMKATRMGGTKPPGVL